MRILGISGSSRAKATPKYLYMTGKMKADEKSVIFNIKTGAQCTCDRQHANFRISPPPEKREPVIFRMQ